MEARPQHLVQQAGGDAAVQYARVALEVFGRGVGGFDDAGLDLVQVQVQSIGFSKIRRRSSGVN